MNNRPCDLSLVVPCYNEEDTVGIFYDEAMKTVSSLISSREISSYEFIFIDDGYKDNTLEEIKKLRSKDSNVHFVSFSRNFGKEAGLFAGLEKSRGRYTAVMDVDLQDPPDLIPQMLKAIREENYSCAATRRTNRKGEPIIKSFFSNLFYKLMGKMTSIEVVSGARDFRLMTREYVDAFLKLRERNRFTKGLFPFVGFKTKWFEYKNVERSAGTTKWSFWKLFVYSIDGIMGFSTKPLAFASLFGIFSLFAAFALIVFIIVRKILFGDPTSGWPSLVCIILFVSGVQLFSIGILGQYIARIYTEIKQRPIYISATEE